MTKPLSFGRFESHLTVGEKDFAETPSEETPFRIVVFGDFSGRGNRKHSPSRKGPAPPLPIDRDNLEEVMARLGIELQLSILGNSDHSLVLRFAQMEDFHPDRIVSRVDIFQNLLKTRQRLLDPSTFSAAAEQVKQWLRPDDDTTHMLNGPRLEPKPAQTDPNRVSADFLLEDLRERWRCCYF